MAEKKEYVCLKEGAQILGIDARTMRKVLEGAEGLNYTRIGGKILINKNKLLKYMDEHTIIRY